MRTLLAILCLVYMAGCTTTYVRTNSITAWRVSLLQKVKFEIEHNEKGTHILYGNDGGQPAAGSIAKAAALILK